MQTAQKGTVVKVSLINCTYVVFKFVKMQNNNKNHIVGSSVEVGSCSFNNLFCTEVVYSMLPYIYHNLWPMCNLKFLINS